MIENQLSPELAKFVEGLVADPELRIWFENFAELPEGARSRQFAALATGMEAAGEHAELIRATRLLADLTVYEAVQRALANQLPKL